MNAYGYDAAYPPAPQIVADAGGLLMAVYLTGNYAVSGLHCAQVHAAGMGVLLNYEQAADELVGASRADGQAIGARAMAAAIRDGAPADGTLGIFYSVDVSAGAGQFAQIGAAFDGINDATHGRFKAHVYGEGALIDYLVNTGRCPGRQWLSGSSSFPGYNPQSSNVGLVQLVGSNVPSTDQNLITNAAGLDAWWPTGSTLGDTDMPLNAADKAWLHDDIVRILTDTNHVYLPTIHAKLDALPDKAAESVWNQPISNGSTLTAAQYVARPAAQVDVAALAAAVAKSLPTTDTAAVQTAIAAALGALKLTISKI